MSVIQKSRKTPYVLISPAHLLLLAVIGVPSIYVFWLSLNDSFWGTSLSYVGWTHYQALFSDPHFWKAVTNTVLIVVGVVYSEMLIGLGMASFFVRGVLWKKVMFSAVLVPYAVSPVVAVLTWKNLMDPNIGLIGKTIPLLGFGSFNWSVHPAHGLLLIAIISLWLHIPFTFIMLYAGMLSIPQTYYDAARIDGANGPQLFRFITLPLLAQTMLVCMIFRLVFSFRMFSEAWLLTKGAPARSTEVLAVYLYRNAFNYGKFGLASTTGWIMVVGALLISSFYLYRMHKRIKLKE
jgi:multiple sugar transport system permease protein